MHRNRLEELANAIIPEAQAWVSELSAYRTYKGKDLEYFRKARIGLGVVSNAVRLCATIENARSNDLIQSRLLDSSGGPKLLNGAPDVQTQTGDQA